MPYPAPLLRKPATHRASVPAAVALAGALVGLAGCSSLDNLFGGERIDYRSESVKTRVLEVPPDLTQLSTEGRYRPQAGVVVSANAMKQPAAGAPAAVPVTAPVAPVAAGALRIERDGQTRWLVSPQTPEQLIPQVRAFWLERGFNLVVDNPDAGVMQTDWAENRAKLPSDFIRNTIGKVFDNLFSTGERDLFRTRIERTPAGSEIYISHRGLHEVVVGALKENTRWTNRPSDPQLEAEFLTRLMLKLSGRDDSANVRSTAAAAVPAAAGGTAPELPARARVLPSVNGAAAMELDEPFDRAWRQVGLALDRGGFTVEDRDRSGGLYFIRYVDPKTVGQDEPGFFAKLFSRGRDEQGKSLQRYRVMLKSSGSKTVAAIQNGAGQSDDSESARAIVARLVEGLR